MFEQAHAQYEGQTVPELSPCAQATQALCYNPVQPPLFLFFSTLLFQSRDLMSHGPSLDQIT